MAILNPIASNWSRAEREKLNNNWIIIERYLLNLQGQINLLTGDVDVQALIDQINDILNQGNVVIADLEAALQDATTVITNAENATTDANNAAQEAQSAIDNMQAFINQFGNAESYDNSKLYKANNIVEFDGSGFICIKDTQGNPPPTLPTKRNEWWQLFAQKGTDGTGAVSKVAGKTPELDGNVPLSAQDIGAVSNEDSGYYKGNNFTIVNPYKAKGQLNLKGQLHCHTTNSDGSKDATTVVTEYKNAGYDFVSITDHDFLTPDPQIDGIVFIPGVEELAWGNHAHIAAYNVTEQQGDAVYPNHETYRPSYKEVIDFHRKRGGITSIAHPDMGTLGMPVDEIIRNDGYHFIEIFNALSGGLYYRKTIDAVLSAGKHFYILATDDYHGETPFNQGYVVVNAEQRNKESILDALKQGSFYASTGNDINIDVDKKTITASSTTLSTFRFIGYNGKVYKETENALEASYEIVGDERYIRVESIRQTDEKVAFSQPIWIQQLNTVSTITKPRIKNLLINSNFDIWQRGVEFTRDVNSPVSFYVADRWWLSSNAENIVLSRIESGDWLGKYYAKLALATKGVSFTDLALLQSPENQLIKMMKGRTITFSVEIRKNSTFNSGKMRLSVATGTVADERNASTGRKTKELLIAHNEIDTQEWRRFSITTSVEFDVESMMCAIRLADVSGQTNHPPDGSYIEIRRTQLIINPDVVEYEIPTFNEELQECLRFYEKSYDYNVSPKTNKVSGGIEVKVVPGNTINANQSYGNIKFKVPKRKMPIVTVIPFSDASKSQIVSSDDGVDFITNSGMPNYIGINGFNVYNKSEQTLTTSRNAVIFHWVADAELY